MPLDAALVADVILAKAAARGERVSNMKLQKLLYYAQGEHLAATGELLFDDRIKAWGKGPVVPGIWHRYRQNGFLDLPEPVQVPTIPAFYDCTVTAVLDRYLSLTAEQLSEMTHRESPWMEARTRGQRSAAISEATLKAHFSQIRSQRREERRIDVAIATTKAQAAGFIHRHGGLFQRLASS
jgi:uncharacterized phage-associated protein